MQTIRNRESAQRSRNQRKVHLTTLESRVLELQDRNEALESELRDLRGSRTNSPLTTAVSPPVTATSTTLTLADIAPPPTGVDVKPVLGTSAPTTTATPELALLRDRVAQLEAILTQLVPLLSPLPAPCTPSPLSLPTANLPVTAAIGIPTQSDNILHLDFQPRTDIAGLTSTLLARHPAAVATLRPGRMALQRARTSMVSRTHSVSRGCYVSSGMINTVARIVLASARLRDWTPSSARSPTRRKMFEARRVGRKGIRQSLKRMW